MRKVASCLAKTGGEHGVISCFPSASLFPIIIGGTAEMPACGYTAKK